MLSQPSPSDRPFRQKKNEKIKKREKKGKKNDKNDKNGKKPKNTCRKECLLLTLFLSRTLFLRVGTATCILGPFLPFGEVADAIPSGSHANAGKTAWAAYPTVRRQFSNPGQCRLGTLVVFLLKRKTGSIGLGA